jgi:hypothetical protein
MNDSIERRKSITNIVMNEMPSNYIQARYMAKLPGKTLSLAGFEAGSPEPKLVVDRFTGKKKLKVELNGFVHVNEDGSCLILDTPFNRLKLRNLCRPGTIKIPKDSKGVEFIVRETKPEFAVEDESIFEGLDPVVASIVEEQAKAKPVALPKGKGKGLVPVAEVEAKKAAEEALDNAAGIGGGRRPEELKLDIE